MAQDFLVTGCAGFIASKVTQLLLDAGHSVTGVDNLNDAYDPRLKQWRLEQLSGRSGFEFRRMDISDRAAVDGLFDAQAERSKPFAAVIHLAARAGVRPSVTCPWIYYDTNCTGTLNLLDACRRCGVGKFVLASTSSLYGAHNPLPYREDADTSRPLSPYAASKKAAETLCYTYHYLFHLDVSVLRYFTVYGPAGRPDMSPFRFIRGIAEGEPIVVFGDGNQERDFTYVDDIARGTVAAIVPLDFATINLGCDRRAPLHLLIELIGKAVGRSPRIEYRPAHRADMPATWADIGKAARLLHWTPTVLLEEGVRRCVDWYYAQRRLVLSLDRGEL